MFRIKDTKFLRKHQLECQNAIIQDVKKNNESTFSMTTGSGKTRNFVSLMQPHILNYTKIIFIFPSLALVKQFHEEYVDKYNIPNVYYICSDKKDRKQSDSEDETPKYSPISVSSEIVVSLYNKDKYIIVSTYQSLNKLLDNFPSNKPADVIMFDECHHEDALKCQDVINNNRHKFLHKISGSATIGTMKNPCFRYPFMSAVKDNICKDYEIYGFIRKDTPENRNALLDYLYEIYKTTGNGKIMAFTAFSEADKQGVSSVNKFQEFINSISSTKNYKVWIKGITAKNSSEERKQIINEFQEQKTLSILVSCKTLSEGVDTKMANAVLFVDSCKSTITIIQRIGRAVRKIPSEPDTPASIITTVFVNADKYADCKTEEDADKVLRESMKENGDFSTIFSILCALKQEDPERYDSIMFSNRVKKYQNKTGKTPEFGKDTSLIYNISKQLKKPVEEVKEEILQYMKENEEENYNELVENNYWNNIDPEILNQSLDVNIKIDEYTDEGELIESFYGDEDSYTKTIHLYKDGEQYANIKNKKKDIKSKIRLDVDEDLRILWRLQKDLDLETSITSRIEFTLNDNELVTGTYEERQLKKCKLYCEKSVDICKKLNIKNCDFFPNKRKSGQEKIGKWVVEYRKGCRGVTTSKNYILVDEMIKSYGFVKWLINNSREEQELEKWNDRINECKKYCKDKIPFEEYLPEVGSEIYNAIQRYRRGYFSKDNTRNIYESVNKLISANFPLWLMTEDKRNEFWAIKDWRKICLICKEYCDKNFNSDYENYMPNEFDDILKKIYRYRTSDSCNNYDSVNQLVNDKFKFKKWFKIETNEEKALTTWKKYITESDRICKDENIQKKDFFPNHEKHRKLYDTLSQYRRAHNQKNNRSVYSSVDLLINNSGYIKWLDFSKKKEISKSAKQILKEKAILLGLNINTKDTKETIQTKIDNYEKSSKQETAQKEVTVASKPIKPQKPKKPMKLSILPKSQESTNNESKVFISYPIKTQLSALHQKYKTMNSKNLNSEFKTNKEKWYEYHKISEENEKSFPEDEIPRNRIKKELDKFKTRNKKVVVDMGCGKAELAQHFTNDKRFEFINYDHVSCGNFVKEVDISNVPLDDDSIDIVILSLAMWGSNCEQYIKEAYRILETSGTLYIIEPTKRWTDNIDTPAHKLKELLIQNSFNIITENIQKFSLIICRKM